MSFHKFETKSNCVGQTHYSATKIIVGDTPFKKESGREIK